jgi:hypothetical protein
LTGFGSHRIQKPISFSHSRKGFIFRNECSRHRMDDTLGCTTWSFHVSAGSMASRFAIWSDQTALEQDPVHSGADGMTTDTTDLCMWRHAGHTDVLSGGAGGRHHPTPWSRELVERGVWHPGLKTLYETTGRRQGHLAWQPVTPHCCKETLSTYLPYPIAIL